MTQKERIGVRRRYSGTRLSGEVFFSTELTYMHKNPTNIASVHLLMSCINTKANNEKKEPLERPNAINPITNYH